MKKTSILCIWIGVDAVSCGEAGPQAQWRPDGFVQEPVAPVDASLAARLEAVRQALSRLATRLPPLRDSAQGEGLGAWRCAGMRVAVADVYLAAGALAWTPLLMRQELVQAMALGQFEQMGLHVGASDVVRIDDPPHGRARMAVAYPHALMAGCAELARAAGVAFESIVPVSALAWHWGMAHRQAAHAVMEVMGVVTEGVGLLVSGQDGHPGDVNVRRATDALTALSQHWQRHRLRAPALSSVSRLPVLDLRRDKGGGAGQGDPSFQFLPDPLPPPLAGGPRCEPGLGLLAASARGGRLALDGVQAAGQPPRAALVMLAAAALLAGALALDGWQSWQEIDTLRAASAARVTPTMRTGAQDPAWSREELARIGAVNDAIARLNLPMDVLLDALKPPKDIKVSVLSVDISPAQAGRRAISVIHAQAQSGQDMARYVAFVSRRPPFSEARLRQHEVMAGETLRPYRFQMEALWSR